MKSGVYQIRNIVNNTFYIGSSKNIDMRWREHVNCLKANRHGNSRLQRVWNKYGPETFVFEVIKECDEKYILQEEQMLLNQFWDDENCLNIAKDAQRPRAGIKRSPESIQKQREKLIGRKLSEEHKEKLRIAGIGRKLTDADKKKISDFRKGKKLTPEHIQKLSEAHQGSKSWTAKLTEDDVREIRQIYSEQKLSSRKIAKMFNIKNHHTILDIIHKRSWKNVS